MTQLELGIVGNCNISALIDAQGRIVWSCVPRFDGDPVFCSLLNGAKDGTPGVYAIELQNQTRSEQCYLRNTAILLTTLYDGNGGAVEICDFAPRFERSGRMFRPISLVRRLRVVSGRPVVRIRLAPACDYGSASPTLSFGSNHVRYMAPEMVLRLTTDASVTAILDQLPFVLDRDVTLILGPDESVPGTIGDMGRHWFEETRRYWEEWVRFLGIPFDWQDAVIRAAITLKLSAFDDTGAIVAAMTTSLPEGPGGGRNWDYRYCWLRDGYFVVCALNRLSATNTMERYLRYIVNVAASSPDGRLQPVYRINGRPNVDESLVPSLTGFRNMGPVRIGNAAYRQVQNDVYGSTVLAAAHMFYDHRLDRPGDAALFHRLEGLGDQAFRVYNQPDSGIWELRNESRVHTFSSVMCWVACDQLAKIARHLGMQDTASRWRQRADEMHGDICARAWDDKQQSFVESFGGHDLDASLLLLHDLGFLAADDIRFAGTVAAVERELKRGDFIFRYTRSDDFGVPETAFLVCTFWYVDALAALGRRDEACALFEKLLGCRNSLGLMSEDIHPDTRELWGNIPQTYSMVGLINSAMRLSRSWEEAY